MLGPTGAARPKLRGDENQGRGPLSDLVSANIIAREHRGNWRAAPADMRLVAATREAASRLTSELLRR